MERRGQIHAADFLTPGKALVTTSDRVAHRQGLDVLEHRKIACPCQHSSDGPKNCRQVHISLVLRRKIIVNDKFIRKWKETSVTCLKSVFCLYLDS
jgi:hypothetical protein